VDDLAGVLGDPRRTRRWAGGKMTAVGSRLALDPHKGLVVVVTTASSPIPTGTVLRVLGNEVGSGPDGAWGFTGRPTGHRNPVTAKRTRNADPIPVDPA
jgi:hypothetical protein